MQEFIGKRYMVNAWNKFVDVILIIKNHLLTVADQIVQHIYKPPKVQSIEETINTILENRASISRYGDGELKLIAGKDISFQRHSLTLEVRLKEILISDSINLLVCIPDIFEKNLHYVESESKAWRQHLLQYRMHWYRNLKKNLEYYNSFISRCYLCFQDKNKSKKYFDTIKRVWANREIVIVEGEHSRLGVGNDLFDSAQKIQRVICQNKHVFEKYEEIFDYIKKMDKNLLILIALGPTATILAYDLHREGFQALDIGHIDVEYEWFLSNADKKMPIKNKFVNEVNGGAFEESILSNKYLSEIIRSFV